MSRRGLRVAVGVSAVVVVIAATTVITPTAIAAPSHTAPHSAVANSVSLAAPAIVDDYQPAQVPPKIRALLVKQAQSDASKLTHDRVSTEFTAAGYTIADWATFTYDTSDPWEVFENLDGSTELTTIIGVVVPVAFSGPVVPKAGSSVPAVALAPLAVVRLMYSVPKEWEKQKALDGIDGIVFIEGMMTFFDLNVDANNDAPTYNYMTLVLGATTQPATMVAQTGARAVVNRDRSLDAAMILASSMRNALRPPVIDAIVGSIAKLSGCKFDWLRLPVFLGLWLEQNAFSMRVAFTNTTMK